MRQRRPFSTPIYRVDFIATGTFNCLYAVYEPRVRHIGIEHHYDRFDSPSRHKTPICGSNGLELPGGIDMALSRSGRSFGFVAATDNPLDPHHNDDI